MNRLDVLISTHGSGCLDRIVRMNLPQVEGVGYLVSCQCAPAEIPAALLRGDIRVVFTPSKGLSTNRNNALADARADYALLCDDDVSVNPDGCRRVIEIFDSNPDVDVAAFIVEFPVKKVYPPAEHDLWQPYKGYDVSSVEIGFRLKSVRDKNLGFNPLWGIGAPKLGCGEEAMFLWSAKRSGLCGRFFPVVVGSHPFESTGGRSEPAVLRANGAYIFLAYPLTAVPRLVLKARRMPAGFFRNLRYLLSGARYALFHRRELLS